VNTQDDKTIAWQGRIQERAAHATKAILDRLATMPKSGLNQLTPIERRDISETVAKSIVDTMSTLGTFVTAGAQDFQVCHLEGVTIGKGGKVALKLIPQAGESGGINLQLLAANADKQVVVAMVNGLAYSQAREALSKAIHREQTDWVQRSQDADMAEDEQGQTPAPVSSAPTADEPGNRELPDNTLHNNDGELIAEQPGDGDGRKEDSSEASSGDTAAGSAGGLERSEGELKAGEGPGPTAGPAVDAGEEGAGPDRDSPLARAGRRVRRRPGAGGDRPAAH
jgi:hypothetical protein